MSRDATAQDGTHCAPRWAAPPAIAAESSRPQLPSPPGSSVHSHTQAVLAGRTPRLAERSYQTNTADSVLRIGASALANRPRRAGTSPRKSPVHSPRRSSHCKAALGHHRGISPARIAFEDNHRPWSRARRRQAPGDSAHDQSGRSSLSLGRNKTFVSAIPGISYREYRISPSP